MVPRIRRARPVELPRILEIDREVMGAGTHRPDTSTHVAWWVAVEGPRIVGYASAHRSHDWVDAVYLARVGVLPCARGRGLQRRLIRVREAWARTWGARWAITDTAPYNAASANSLVGCGYRLYFPRRPWAGESSIYFRRCLA